MDDTLVVTQPQEPVVTTAAESNIDLSAYFVADNPGTFDMGKITELVKDRDNKDQSARYFQSQFMKKSGASEDINDYLKDFKPDSSYESVWNGDKEKDELTKAMHNDFDEFKKFAHENKLSTRDAQIVFDYYMRMNAKEGLFDRLTPEQQQISIAENNRLIEEYNKTLLQSLNRSKSDNDNSLQSFINSQNIISSNPEMKKYLEKIVSDSPEGYMFATILSQAIDHQGVPVVSGTVQGKDESALMKALEAEKNPDLRDKMMREFYGIK